MCKVCCLGQCAFAAPIVFAWLDFVETLRWRRFGHRNIFLAVFALAFNSHGRSYVRGRQVIKPPPAAMLHLRLEGGMFAQDRVARRMTQGHLCYAERGVQGRSPWPPGFPPGASRAPFHRVKKGGEGGGRGGSHAQKSQFFLANRRGWLCPLCC